MGSSIYGIHGIIYFSQRYVEEHIQKTGVAIETQGFTFITSGKKRESLTVRISPFRFLDAFIMKRFVDFDKILIYGDSYQMMIIRKWLQTKEGLLFITCSSIFN